MKVHNAIEKQQIMLLSDLLSGNLSVKEISEVQESNLDINEIINSDSIKIVPFSNSCKIKLLIC